MDQLWKDVHLERSPWHFVDIFANELDDFGMANVKSTVQIRAIESDQREVPQEHFRNGKPQRPFLFSTSFKRSHMKESLLIQCEVMVNGRNRRAIGDFERVERERRGLWFSFGVEFRRRRRENERGEESGVDAMGVNH